MQTNKICVPTRGKDRKKFIQIAQFSSTCQTPMQKVMIDQIRMAGNIGKFISSHAIDIYTMGENYNGYGWEDHTTFYLLTVHDFNILKQMIEVKNSSSKKRKVLSEKEKIEKWARRLSKLTEISVEEAVKIADEKLEYQRDRIWELEERQASHHSIRRQALINKLIRENPLRRIDSLEHAYAIMKAHNRHTHSDYEDQLAKARELAWWGDLEYDKVKSYAREHMTYDQIEDDEDDCDE